MTTDSGTVGSGAVGSGAVGARNTAASPGTDSGADRASRVPTRGSARGLPDTGRAGADAARPATAPRPAGDSPRTGTDSPRAGLDSLRAGTDGAAAPAPTAPPISAASTVATDTAAASTSAASTSAASTSAASTSAASASASVSATSTPGAAAPAHSARGTADVAGPPTSAATNAPADQGTEEDGDSADAQAAEAAEAAEAARRERYAALTDRCHRLVRFLHEVAISQSEQLVDVDENPLVIWLADLPAGLSLFEAAGAGEILLEAPAAALLPPPPPLPEILRGRVRLPVRDSGTSADGPRPGIILRGPVPPADVDLSAPPVLIPDLPDLPAAAAADEVRDDGSPAEPAATGSDGDAPDGPDATDPGAQPNGTAPRSAGSGTNGSGTNGSGTNGSGTNGSAPKGAAGSANGSKPSTRNAHRSPNGIAKSSNGRSGTGGHSARHSTAHPGGAGRPRGEASLARPADISTAGQVPADVAAAFAEWARAWQVWSSRARADADRRHLHTTLYGVAQRLAQEGDTLELVLATGLLTWWLPRPVRRHLLVTRLVVETDPMSSAVRLRVPAGTSTRLEDSAFLDGVTAFRPERTNALHERLRSRDAVPLGADDERLLRDWLTLAVDGQTEGYRPNWPPPGPGGPSASITLAPALVLRSRGHAALLNYYEQMLDALRGDGLPPLGLAQLVETLDTSERLAWLAEVDRRGPGSAAILPPPSGPVASDGSDPPGGGPADQTAGSTGAGGAGAAGSPDWLSPLPISPEQARVMRRLRLDNGVVVEGPPGTGKTHTIANLISALLAEGRRVLVTSQKGQALRVLQEKLPPELRRLCVSLTEDAVSGAGELATSVSALAAQKAVYDAASQDQRIRTARQRRDTAVAERDRISSAVAARRAAEWRRHGTYEVGAGWSGTRAEIAARLRDEAPELGWIPVPVPVPDGGGWPRPPLNDSESAELWRLLTTPDPPTRRISRVGGGLGQPLDPASADVPTTPLLISVAGRLVRTPNSLPPLHPLHPSQAQGYGQPGQQGQPEQDAQASLPGTGPRAGAGGRPAAGPDGQVSLVEAVHSPSDPPTVPSPITSAIALSALREQRSFGLPPELGELPTRSELTALAYAERGALHAAEAAEQSLSRQAALMVPVLANALTRAGGDEAADRLSAGVEAVLRTVEIIHRLTTRQGWVADALADAFAGRATVLWTKVAAAAPAIADATQAVVELGLRRVELPVDETGSGPDMITLLSCALALREHLESGGGLRRFFRSKAQKDARVLLERTTVDGVAPRSPELLDLVLCRLRAEVALEAAGRAWALLGVTPDPAAELEVRLTQLTEAQDAARAIDTAVAARDRLAALLIDIGARGITLDSPNACVDLGTATNAYRQRQAATAAGTQLRELTAELVAAAAQPDAVDELALLAMAVEARDPAGYVAALEATADALNGRARARRRDELLGRVREAHPVLADLLLSVRFAAVQAATAGNPAAAANGFPPEMFEAFGKAWSHAVAATWLARVRATDQADLDAGLDAADELVASATAELAGALAWKHCLERMGTEQSAALRAYADAMAAGGRFTGRHAERYRQAAREAMRIAQTAVPAWVMPISEVLSTIPAVRDSFDVVIVDEGSQAGLESLFLLWLAPRVIVVGDDRQCTPPDASVEELEPVFTRLDTLLPDIPSWLRVGFTPRSSLFSLLRTRFGDVVRLREHFRCMPEIIEWSSAMFYRDAPLVPLRQFGVDRLAPLRAQYVPHAYTTATPDGPRNPVEAEALVTQVLQCAEDPRYRGLTFGIVVLQGTAQSELIRSELSARMSAAEQQRRRLRVGSPPDFQGDERDVVFLSLVVAPGTPTTSLTRLEYQRRFNVAASRARDQVWLFHSVSTSDLEPADLRHSYLSYVLAYSSAPPLANAATPLTPSEVSPALPHPRFDSLFEQRVFLALAGRGYHVTPQVEINGRRFDLVVSGGRARMAVECDGDTTRSTEDVERDLSRERELRRVGWRIWRVRRSEFEIDPEAALAPLWPRLAAAGILPTTTTPDVPTPPAPTLVTPAHPDPSLMVTQLLAPPTYGGTPPTGATATGQAALPPAPPAPAAALPAASQAAHPATPQGSLPATPQGSLPPGTTAPAPQPGPALAPDGGLPVPEPRGIGSAGTGTPDLGTPSVGTPSVGASGAGPAGAGRAAAGRPAEGTALPGSAGAWPTSGGSPTGWASVGTSPSGFPGARLSFSGTDSWPGVSVPARTPDLPADDETGSAQDSGLAAGAQSGTPTGTSTSGSHGDGGAAATDRSTGDAEGGAGDQSGVLPGGGPRPAAAGTAPDGSGGSSGSGASTGGTAAAAETGATGHPLASAPVVPSVHADPEERRARWRPITLSELEGLDDAPPED